MKSFGTSLDQPGQLGLGQLAHVEVVALGHLAGFGDLDVQLLEPPILRREPVKRTMLADRGGKLRRIAEDDGVDELALEFLETVESFFEEIAHGKKTGGWRL